MSIDFLIVGQGLAGSLLAWQLIQRGYRVLVVDEGGENASQVAAGLINPLSGQRLVKPPNLEPMLAAALACYRELEAVFGQRFYVELPMLRILRSDRERNYAEKRLQQPEYADYLSQPAFDLRVGNNAYGHVTQTCCGYLRTRPLLAELRKFLIATDSYRQMPVDYSEIVLEPVLQWRQYKPRHLVFCEGHRASRNPWFSKLPFQLAKGEILTCETSSVIPGRILNYGRWLLPLAAGRFKTGATFDTQQLDDLPTTMACATLLNDLRPVCRDMENLQVSEHKAGIRPATLDKQPFIGSHPRHNNLYIFNGFGSKGSLTIPWYGQRFIDRLEQEQSLPSNCNIERYYETYFPY